MPLDNSKTRLENAIAAVALAKERLDKIAELLSEFYSKSGVARDNKRVAERALNDARQHESRDTVNALLDDTVVIKSVADCEQEFTRARVEYDRIHGIIINLQREEQNAQRQLSDAESNRTDAVRAVMNTHPAVIAAYQKYAALQAEVAAMNAALLEIFRSGGNPKNWRGFPIMERVERRDFDSTLRDKWSAAIQTLSETGAFPEVE